MTGSYRLAAAIALLVLAAPVRNAVAQEVEVEPQPVGSATAMSVDSRGAESQGVSGIVAAPAAPVALVAPVAPLALGVLPTSGQLSPFAMPTAGEMITLEEELAAQGRSRIALSNMLMIGGSATALIGLAVIGGNVGGITALAGTGVAVYGLYLHFR